MGVYVVVQTEPLLTTDDVAARTRFHPETIRNMAREGRIPGARLVAGRWRFDQSAIEEWVRGEGPEQPDENK